MQSKGNLMEELLRNYFLELGYYVSRGVLYKHEGNDVTDVDLYLYGRSSSLTRQRINVDIKNKKTPQAFERILWANGLRVLLGFDSCIVATTDQRPSIHTFGQTHSTIVLDGTFLSKLQSKSYPDRLSEEELASRFSKCRSYNTFGNKDWKYIYEQSKSKLLNEQDFSGFNTELIYIRYFIEKIMTDDRKRENSTRLLYLIISHLLVIIDYIIKDIAFLDVSEREKRLSDGFKFGNLGKIGVDKIISMAVQISGNRPANSFLKALDSIPTDILKEFFGKNENSKNLFNWAKEFEKIGYGKDLIFPENIDPHLKGIISLFLDFFGYKRNDFFGIYLKNIQPFLFSSENDKNKNL